MLAGGLLATGFGLFEGYLSFRYGLRGPYFSLVTLAFAEMLRVVTVNLKVVGASLGLVVPQPGQCRSSSSSRTSCPTTTSSSR